jgi:site-specific recombinase XerD
MKTKLTPSFIDTLNLKSEKQYYGDTEVPGLVLVIPGIPKKKKISDISYSFYFNYRSTSHGPTKELIGRYGAITLNEARRKAKLIAAQAIEKKDRYSLKKAIGKGYTVRTLIEEFFDKRLREPNYKKKTIAAIKNTIETWIFKKSLRPEITKFYDYIDIADYTFDRVNQSIMKDIHVAVMAKAPYSANRLIAYLKVICNYGIGASIIKTNPCVGIKLFKESESEKILTSAQIEAIINATFVVDKRTNKLNFRYYYQKGYGVVACIVIAWILRTGRRPDSEGMAIKWSSINWDKKTIYLDDSKVGPMNYKLDSNGINILQTIQRSNFKDINMLNEQGETFKSNKFSGPFSYNDIRREYVFPSHSYGKKTPGGKIGKTPHITNVDATWKKILSDLNISYLPLKQCRHSWATDFYLKTRNLKALQRALGHSKLKTTAKYLKFVEQDYEKSLDSYAAQTGEPNNNENILPLFKDS